MTSFSESRRFPSPRAVKCARNLIEELCIDRVEHIDVERIVFSRPNAILRRKSLKGEQGRLVRQAGGGAAVIVVATDLQLPRERFVIAHELGHLELHPELDQFKSCSAGDMRDYRGDGREPEANRFAAELLMPRKLFEPRCDVKNASLSIVFALAAEFRSSNMAAGIQFAHYCPHPSAFVYSRSGAIVWGECYKEFPYYIKRGWRLPHGSQGTYAGDFHAGKPIIHDYPVPVDADTWTDSYSAAGGSIDEHSRGWTDRHGITHVLTLLKTRGTP